MLMMLMIGLCHSVHPGGAVAQDASNGALEFSNQLALRYNPLGLQDELFVGYKMRLYNVPEENLLFGKGYLWTGGILRASPQFLQSGLFIKALPIAILEVQASAVRVQAISDDQSVLDAPYFTQGTQDAVSESGSIITNGWIATLQARLQYKKGPVAVRNTSLFRRFELEGPDEGRFYEQTFDVVTPFKSWVLQNDTDLLYADSNKPWVVGVRYTHVSSISDEIHTIQRVGPLLAWKFKGSSTATAKPPRNSALIILSQWHVKHNWRTGQSNSQAVPYFALVYVLSGTFTD